MEEIKVNEYVRTKRGEIYKIEDGTEFYEDSVNVGIGVIPDVDGIWVDKKHFIYVDKRDIVKHSPNIIDLIEEGDYVNGNRMDIVEKDENGHTYYIQNCELPSENLKDIKSIVTKEQFNQVKYEV